MRQSQTRSIEKMVEDQSKKWAKATETKMKKKQYQPVIAISRQPGSRGQVLGKLLAEVLKYDFYDREMVDAIASNAKTSTAIVQSLDEKGRQKLEDWIGTLINNQHFFLDDYQRHLIGLVNTMGRHGSVVVIGRGVSFILPANRTLRIRTVAPLDTRIKNWAEDKGISNSLAERQVLELEADQRAFVRKYFNAAIADASLYDLVINTETIPPERAVELIKQALLARFQK